MKRLFDYCMRPKMLYFYALAVLLIPNVGLCVTERMSLIAAGANCVFPLFAYALLLALCRRTGMMVWCMFPIIFLSAFQIVLLYLFGNSVIAVDMFLDLVTTNPGEAMELLDNMQPVLVLVFVLYVPMLVFSAFSVYRKLRLADGWVRSARRWSCGGMVLGVLLTVGAYVYEEDYAVQDDLFPLNACYNAYLAYERSMDVAHYRETSSGFSYQAHATHPEEKNEVYVLVVGETSRACNWGLYGYERQTTPRLYKQKNLVHFTDVLTQANATHKSVPMLLSLASAENYDRIYQERSVITAFKEAGFYTAYFSNQKYNHSFVDIFGQEADTTLFLKEQGEARSDYSDHSLLTCVDGVMRAGHPKLLVVLHTYGSHFNYRERYSEPEAVYVPDGYTDAGVRNRKQLLNAYDNTIVQTDSFLSELICRLENSHTVSALMYTSDHGEDIYDDERRLFLHSSPVPSYYQLHVPFLVWLSDRYMDDYPQTSENLKGNSRRPVSSNLSFVHTAMQLAGISSPYREDSLSVASDKYKLTQRYYIDDHNEPRPYSAIGLSKHDEQQFRQRGLSFP